MTTSLTSADLEKLVAAVLAEYQAGHPAPEVVTPDGATVPDLSEIDFREVLDVDEPFDEQEYRRLKLRTTARLGVGRAGPHYRTATLLRFRADHAAAMDAVFTEVDQDLLRTVGLTQFTTACSSKDEYLTRPDLGTQFTAEVIEAIKATCRPHPTAQIYVSDGLSSTAIEANLVDVLPAIMQGLEFKGIDVGTPFFVRFGRVRAMDVITEALDATVCVVLIGERPGLATGESMSAYMSYRGRVGMPEAERTVISNIHRGGTNPVEAGAHIAEVIDKMLKQQASGLALTI